MKEGKKKKSGLRNYILKHNFHFFLIRSLQVSLSRSQRTKKKGKKISLHAPNYYYVRALPEIDCMQRARDLVSVVLGNLAQGRGEM